MSGELSKRSDYPASAFLRRLCAAGSELGRQLTRNLDVPLRAYLQTLVPPVEQPRAANAHLKLVASALDRYLDRYADTNIADICDHLLRVPVMQMADHSNLLLDVETFLHNYLFHIACRDAGARVMISSQCSTVSCLSRRQPVAGPVFLHTRGDVYKVFPLSKRQLKDSTFCALPTPLTMTMETVDGARRPPASDPILASLVGRRVRDAAGGYRECNDLIWAQLPVWGNVRRVAVDESLTSELLALHLERPRSPVCRLLYDPQVRDTFLDVKRQLVASTANLAVNRPEPDFLWCRRDTRLLPVVLRGRGARAEFVVDTSGSFVDVPSEPRQLARALRDGNVYGDRILSYFVRCLLPAIVAVGGTSQQDYVALYRRMFLETDARVPFLESFEVEAISRRDCSRLGGAALFEPDDEARNVLAMLGPESPLQDLERRLLDRPLGDTIGRLECARYFERAIDRVQRTTA